MRLFKTSTNDENRRLVKKESAEATAAAAAALKASQREVLADVTQLKNETVSKIKPSTAHHNIANIVSSNVVTTNNSKIQIYKQQYQPQYKKPRLEKILQTSRLDSDTEEEQDIAVLQYEDDDLADDDMSEDKENIPHSDDAVIERHFDRLPKQIVVHVDEEYEEEEVEVEDEEEEEDQQVQEQEEAAVAQSVRHREHRSHVPMEPIWTQSIFNELQMVIKKYSRDTLDQDDEDTFDVTMVAEYAPEIFNYLHELENRLIPDPNYMDNQDELKWEMRAVLIDWVVQVHSRFNLLPETLFLTVNYIDRFLSRRKVSLSRFQLVGAVALFIAAKYEEINCPTVQEVAYMADNAYSIDDFLKAERFMIDVLEFDMGWPGPMSFLRRTSKADDYDYETRTLAKYFLEITIMDSRFVASQPSWLAAGAHYLSRNILNKGEWTELHVFYSGYTEAQLKPLAEVLLRNCHHAETHHKAIFEKYQERRYRRSSAFVQEYFDSLE